MRKCRNRRRLDGSAGVSAATIGGWRVGTSTGVGAAAFLTFGFEVAFTAAFRLGAAFASFGLSRPLRAADATTTGLGRFGVAVLLGRGWFLCAPRPSSPSVHPPLLLRHRHAFPGALH